MEAIGYGKGAKRNLYHVIIAPAHGETLNAAQQKIMVKHYAEQMGFKNHQYVLVEHWKKGKQHFHLVFNIIDPITGKTHELKWTKRKEWRITRELEKIFGFSAPKPKGKPAGTWETQRGKRTGIDPIKMRKGVTAIFHASKTTKEFIKALADAGFALTRGRQGQLVLVDINGDTHGLMRRIEGKNLADLRQKFPDIETIALPLHADLVIARKPSKGKKHRTAQCKAHRTKAGKYGGSGYILNGQRLGATAKLLTPAHFVQKVAPVATGPLQSAAASVAKTKIDPNDQQSKKNIAPIRPKSGGWPEAAVADWEAWGHKSPPRFFAKWPELKS
jgi:hypothetical protein